MDVQSETRGMYWVAMQFILVIIWFLATSLGERYYPSNTLRMTIQSIGVALILAGIFMAGRGVYDLGRSFTPLPDPKRSAELVRTGIYSHVRHPMYGGTVLTLAGITCIFITPLGVIFLALIVLFFFSKSRYEEERLRERFPEYDEYAKGTRRMIPWVW